MKAAFFTESKMAKKVQEIINREFKEIKLTIYEYRTYDELINILKSNGKEYDAIIFSGYIPYYIAKKNLKSIVPCYFFKIKESCIKGALLKILYLGHPIKRISYDANEEWVENIYKELDIVYEKIYVKYESTNLEEIYEITEREIEDVFLFHKNLYINKKTDFCLTTASVVEKMLKTEKIPHVYVGASNDSIRDTFTKAYLKYSIAKNQNSQIVTVAVNIDMPNEYSINKEDEYSLVLEKEKIEQEVYKFAQKISAAVVPMTSYGYLLFSTKRILEVETDYFSNIELVKNIEKISLRTISIGVGYGESGLAAKYNAFKGLNKSQQSDKNCTYVVYEDESIVGPIYSTIDDEDKNEFIDEKLLKIALKSNLSVNTIYTLYEISNRLKQDTFTSKDLAEYYGISSRGINRIILKLEDAGFVEVVGRKINSQLGRPSRIIKLKF